MTNKILKIANFKCLNRIEVSIKNLTVLAGRNSAGKSSITQAFRLLREASRLPPSTDIHLNDSAFSLGTFDEIINNSDDNIFESFEVSFSDKASSTVSTFIKAEDSDECEFIKTNNQNELLSNSSPLFFMYLSAERYGPRLRQTEVNGHRKSNIGLGSKGEFVAEVLADNQTKRIDEDLIHPELRSSNNALLSSNVEKWMSNIVGGIFIRSTRPPRLAHPYLEFRKSERESDWQFPTNHGYGISYTLPIIVACLLLEKGGYLIVDSPEAHLHPAAQTEIAKFLAFIAGTGRNIIIETHSDHVLDGLRLSIANPNFRISAENAIFHYVDRNNEDQLIHRVIQPKSDGSLPMWPPGFFDQMAENLRALSILNRKTSNERDSLPG